MLNNILLDTHKKRAKQRTNKNTRLKSHSEYIYLAEIIEVGLFYFSQTSGRLKDVCNHCFSGIFQEGKSRKQQQQTKSLKNSARRKTYPGNLRWLLILSGRHSQREKCVYREVHLQPMEELPRLFCI